MMQFDDVPGVASDDNEGFLYVQYQQSFRPVFRGLQRFISSLPASEIMGLKGAVVEEPFTITTPDFRRFGGILFRKSVAHWADLVRKFALQEGITIARIEERCIVLDDGTRFPLEQCKLQRHKKYV